MAFCASAATASSTIYDCKLTTARDSAWIDSSSAIEFDADTKQVWVLNGVSIYFAGGVVPGRVVAEKPGELRLGWRVQVHNDTTNAMMDYTAIIDTAHNTVRVVASPGARYEKMERKGGCKLSHGKSGELARFWSKRKK